MTRILNAFLVILAVHDAIAGELSAEFILFLLVLRAPPRLYNAEHETTTIHSAILTHIALGWVVEDAIDDAINGAGWVDTLVVPTGDELRDNPFQDLRSDFTCWLVEDLVCISL